MVFQQYCSWQIDSAYIHFLRFSRLNGCENNQTHEILLHALNELSEPINPQIQCLLALIYHNLNKTGLFNQLSTETQSLIKQSAMSIIANDMANKRWLDKIFKILNENHIPIILLKGAAFSNNLYPNNAPRPGVDIDFLVTQNDFDLACTLLSEIMTPVVLDSKRFYTHQKLFERMFVPNNDLFSIVEIHRSLTNPYIFNINEDYLWKSSKLHPAYNSELIRILSPENTLLHLAVHAFRDLDFCNHNLLDTHEIFNQWNPNPNVLIEYAKQWKAKHVLYYLLESTSHIMNTPVNESLLTALKPGYLLHSLNKQLLGIKSKRNINEQITIPRYIQLLSQLTFPDKATRGMIFQIYYANLRLGDWLKSINL